MALTTTEEAVARQLLTQYSQLLALASQSATIQAALAGGRVTIDELPNLGRHLVDTDLTHVNSAGVDYKLTMGTLRSYLFGSTGSGGTINSTVVESMLARETGVVKHFAGTAAALPAGYLQLKGQSLPKATFPALYAIIGDAAGVHDDSDLFVLPDATGLVFRGLDATGEIDAQSGRTLLSVQGDMIRAHSHTEDAQTPAGQPYRSARGGVMVSDASNVYGSWSVPTSPTGGAETRMKNIALTAAICVGKEFSASDVHNPLWAYNVHIMGDAQSINLHDLAVAAGWDGVSSEKIKFTIYQGVVVRGTPQTQVASLDAPPTGVTTPAITCGDTAGGDWLLVVQSGAYVVGAGGVGGIGKSQTVGGGNDGGVGIASSAGLSIDNRGVIGGGGGGGGGGNDGGGGGGAGFGPYAVGGGTDGAIIGDPSETWGTPGKAGSLTSGGIGGYNWGGATPTGGSGGALGAAGTAGVDGAAGGAAGDAVTGSVTWVYRGDVRGSAPA